MATKDMKAMLAKHAAKPASVAHNGLMPKGAKAKPFKKGGSVDGVATKGKTKGTMVKMAGGGMARKGMCK